MASGAVLASMTGAGVMTVAKFAAAAFSGSSGMAAEGIRSAVNCGNAGLLAFGQWRSRKPPDRLHPFGYGLELYFWTLVVSMLLFAIAGGATIYKGVNRIRDPQPLSNVGWSYAVLGVSAVLAIRSWRYAYREFRAGRGDRSLRLAVKKAKDPTALLTLFDGTASLAGLTVAFLGLLLSRQLDLPVLDGVASLVIGVLMATVAGFMVFQCKQLVVGESATKELKEAIKQKLEADPGFERVEELLTMHLGPQDILVVAVARFRPELWAPEAGKAIARAVAAVKAAHPEVSRVFIQPAAG